jgi:hypothetical protein
LKDRFSLLGRESPKRREPILLNFAFVATNAMLANSESINLGGSSQAGRRHFLMETYGNRERSILRRFFVNENEDQAIRRKMGEAGIRNFSTFARYMLLTGRVQVMNFEELSKLRQEINRIGVNINQIARQVNTNEEASREELIAVLEKLQEIEELIEGRIAEAEEGG